MLRTKSAHELYPAWPYAAVLVHLQPSAHAIASQRSFLISLKSLSGVYSPSFPHIYTYKFAQTKKHTYYSMLSLKQVLLSFAFLFGLVWLFPVVSHPTIIKENKSKCYDIHLQCFSKDIDKKHYFSLTLGALHYPEKSQKPQMSLEGLGKDVREQQTTNIAGLHCCHIQTIGSCSPTSFRLKWNTNPGIYQRMWKDDTASSRERRGWSRTWRYRLGSQQLWANWSIHGPRWYWDPAAIFYFFWIVVNNNSSNNNNNDTNKNSTTIPGCVTTSFLETVDKSKTCF